MKQIVLVAKNKEKDRACPIPFLFKQVGPNRCLITFVENSLTEYNYPKKRIAILKKDAALEDNIIRLEKFIIPDGIEINVGDKISDKFNHLPLTVRDAVIRNIIKRSDNSIHFYAFSKDK